MRILVVEHHAMLASTLQTYLSSRGHTVSLARSLQQAQTVLQTEDFHAMITDVNLPDGNCHTLLARSDVKLPPAIATMSGFDDAKAHQAAVPAIRHHLVKPFAPEELNALLTNFAQLGSSASTS